MSCPYNRAEKKEQRLSPVQTKLESVAAQRELHPD
jgi:hypothetical protein